MVIYNTPSQVIRFLPLRSTSLLGFWGDITAVRPLRSVLTLIGWSSGSLSFVELAKALHKGGTADFGEGNTVGYAAKDKSGHLAPWAFDRRALGEEDICIQIAYSGICHSDVHQIRNEWGNTQFPCNPGCALLAHSCIAAQPFLHNLPSSPQAATWQMRKATCASRHECCRPHSARPEATPTVCRTLLQRG